MSRDIEEITFQGLVIPDIEGSGYTCITTYDYSGARENTIEGACESAIGVTAVWLVSHAEQGRKIPPPKAHLSSIEDVAEFYSKAIEMVLRSEKDKEGIVKVGWEKSDDNAKYLLGKWITKIGNHEELLGEYSLRLKIETYLLTVKTTK